MYLQLPVLWTATILGMYYGQQCQPHLIQCVLQTLKHFSLIYNTKVPPLGRYKVPIAIKEKIMTFLNDILYFGRWITMFQSNMLPLSSWLNEKMESAHASRMVIPIYQTIRHHIPEDHNNQTLPICR